MRPSPAPRVSWPSDVCSQWLHSQVSPLETQALTEVGITRARLSKAQAGACGGLHLPPRVGDAGGCAQPRCGSSAGPSVSLSVGWSHR